MQVAGGRGSRQAAALRCCGRHPASGKQARCRMLKISSLALLPLLASAAGLPARQLARVLAKIINLLPRLCSPSTTCV